MARDFYDVLGVPRDASEADIKKAYRKLAMEHHPDRNNGDKKAEETFKQLTEAYDALRDPDKRARYDRYGQAGLKASAGGGFHPFDLSEALSVFMRDFGGMGGFDAFFGGGERGRRARRRGQDIRITLRLSLEDVATGTTRKVKLKTLERCAACKGSGAKSGSGAAPCRTCGGVGEVRRAAQSFLGQFVSVSACPDCEGEGTIITDLCPQCRGDGRVRADKTVDVDVPAGVASNNYLTLREHGAQGPRNGPAGDLLIVLEIEDDQRFERHGDDLIYDLPLSFSQAALGGEFTVPTPRGTTTVGVPAGTQSETVITVRGKGLPSLQDGRTGDLHVRARVWTPVELTAEQEELFRRLKAVEGDPPSESIGRRFWNKMREALGG